MKIRPQLFSVNPLDTRIHRTRQRASTSTRWHFAFGAMLP